MEISYESIKPLIISESIDGLYVKVTFQASNQSKPIETAAYVAPTQDDVQETMKEQQLEGKRYFRRNLIGTVISFIGNFMGGIGGTVTSTVGSAVSGKNTTEMAPLTTDITEERKQAAVVEAFVRLKAYFNHNGVEWEFVPPED